LRTTPGTDRQIILRASEPIPVWVRSSPGWHIRYHRSYQIIAASIVAYQKVSELIPQLYLHGLSVGDFDLALCGLLGEDAPLSAATVSRPKVGWGGWRRSPGHPGIRGELANVCPDAAEQRCWNYKIINVLDELPKRQHEQAKLMLQIIQHTGSPPEPERLKSEFSGWCPECSYDAATESLERDWERMVTFYDFPAEH